MDHLNENSYSPPRQLMQSLFGILAAAFILLGLGGGLAQGAVIDPTLPVAGKSQLELSEQWWQWALGIPISSNPISDPDGSFAQVNNNGPVFFVAGNFGGNTTRTFRHPDL